MKVRQGKVSSCSLRENVGVDAGFRTSEVDSRIINGAFNMTRFVLMFTPLGYFSSSVLSKALDATESVAVDALNSRMPADASLDYIKEIGERTVASMVDSRKDIIDGYVTKSVSSRVIQSVDSDLNNRHGSIQFGANMVVGLVTHKIVEKVSAKVVETGQTWFSEDEVFDI